MAITDEQLDAKYESGRNRLMLEKFITSIPNLFNPLLTEETIKIENIEIDVTWSSKWDAVMRSRLIESLLFNIPVKPIILYKKNEHKLYKLVDGRERIEAIKQFYFNQLPLSGIQVYQELNGKKYSNLPYRLRYGLNHRHLNFVGFFPMNNNTSELEMKQLIEIVKKRLNTNNHEIG